MPERHASGMASVMSARPVAEIVQRIKTMLESKGIQLFAVVDHSGEAARVGLEMPDTKLLIFGNPAAGTPVMLAAPSAAIDLPLKILVAQEGNGARVSWNDPEYLRQRHGFSAELVQNIAAVEKIARTAAG